jgi:putative OPT family oligopeptide transporter
MSQHENETAAAHKPYVPDEQVIPEFTWSAVIVGAVLGIVFGASSLYLVLKVGMTISASIPVAVLSITLFRAFTKMFGMRRRTILENNIVQTTGSAGESIAFGVGVTMPAVMILGFEMEIARVMVVSVLGGILGILMMSPLRRAFIVKQHGTLKYPEGTACADVLIIGETGGATAKTVFAGFGLAFLYQILGGGLRLWKEVVSRPLDWFQGATPALEANPALLGVGYIIGTRISSIMVAGGILAAFIMVPTIKFFGDSLSMAVEPADTLIKNMSAEDIRLAYVRYIGAGAVAAGGIISLCRALPLIIASIGSGLRDMRGSVGSKQSSVRRTDRDLPLKWVLFGSLLLVGAIWVFLGVDPQTHPGQSFVEKFSLYNVGVNLAASVLIVLFGFLFVTVSSRLTGEIGSSSNPISGMTLATLLLTCLIFLLLGWTGSSYRLLALSVAAIVCIAASNGGTTSQDLKTGFLVGATPKWQQWSILVGSISSALVIGAILILLNDAGTIYSSSPKNLPPLKCPLDMEEIERLGERERGPDGKLYWVWHAADENPQGVRPGKYDVDDQGKPHYLVDPGINGQLTRRDDGTEVRKLAPPQAELFALITKGILTRKLPWILVLLGVALALVMELSGVSSLPFAVGVYLPLSSSAPIFVGGLVRYAVERLGKTKGEKPASELESEMSPGVLFSTGFIAGGTLAGVLVTCLNFSDTLLDKTGLWQYRRVPVAAYAKFDEQCLALAKFELGEDAAEKELRQKADEIKELNSNLPKKFVPLKKETTLELPGNEQAIVEKDTTLGEFAKNKLNSEAQAGSLFDLNSETLELPDGLPAGAEMRMPQRNAPARAAVGALAINLYPGGLGWILKAKDGSSDV